MSTPASAKGKSPDRSLSRSRLDSLDEGVTSVQPVNQLGQERGIDGGPSLGALGQHRHIVDLDPLAVSASTRASAPRLPISIPSTRISSAPLPSKWNNFAKLIRPGSRKGFDDCAGAFLRLFGAARSGSTASAMQVRPVHADDGSLGLNEAATAAGAARSCDWLPV